MRYIYKDWENEILSLTHDTIECAIASAYLSPYGVQFLDKLTKKLANSVGDSKVSIKILLSDQFSSNPIKRKEILEKLEKLPSIEVRIYSQDDSFLHCKNFIFKTKNEIKAIIGSVNLKNSGFFRNIEFASFHSHSNDDPQGKKLIGEFSRLWKSSQNAKSFIQGDSMYDDYNFKAGDNVKVIRSGKIGTINRVISGSRNNSYRVTIDGQQRTYPGRDLELLNDVEENIVEDYISGKIGGHNDYRVFQTWFRLSKPLEHNLYSYLGSKTIFNPHQFKPLLKFINPNSDERLFIADEVGVGKTIETGIIITEMLARNRLKYHNPIWIVCPNSLTPKWARELKERFLLDFQILDGPKLQYVLNTAIQDGVFPKNYAFSIVSLQLLRRKENFNLLKELDSKRETSTFGLIVVDEAHHMRNLWTDSNNLGNLLTELTEMLLMLSATPLNLHSDDLFNQMHILNSYVFPDKTTFEALYKPVISLNKIRRSLSANDFSKRVDVWKEFSLLSGDSLGNVILEHEGIKKLFERLNDPLALTSEELVKYDRLLVSLNPLSNSFTRTRKREALEHQIIREVLELPITLSPEEIQFQNDAMAVIQNYHLSKGGDPRIIGFITNTYRRMISSCIPAMCEYLEYALRSNLMYNIGSNVDLEEIEDDSEIAETEIDDTLRIQFSEMLRNCGQLQEKDRKYVQFKQMLDKIISNPDTSQVIVFSFFVRTLKYLERRLKEDGYRVGVIHGEIPVESKIGEINRYQIMDSFKRGDFDILLSSEVGGEGLDFQYCHAIINYDLPYNPMRIEQRIGRIDRFGQQADKIIVCNLFIVDTVDEEIYDRLYRRINLIEDGVGAFEPIMGDLISDIQNAIISGNPSESEKEELSNRLQERKEEAKAEYEQFEKVKAELLSDDYLTKPLNSTNSSEFVSPSDALELTDFYLSKIEGCKFKKTESARGIIGLSPELCEQLESFSIKAGNEGAYNELKVLFSNTSQKKIIFDGQLAEKYSDHLFLSPTGFWMKFVTSMISNSGQLSNSFKFNLPQSSQYLPTGEYVIFLYEIQIEGLRTEIEFLGIPIDVKSGQAVDTDYEKIPRLVALEPGFSDDSQFSEFDIYDLKDNAIESLEAVLDKKRQVASDENRYKIDSRIAAFKQSCLRTKERADEYIETHKKKQISEGKTPDDNYIQMTKGKYEKKRAIYLEKINELKKRQEPSLSSNLVAIIQVIVGGGRDES